jgi:hypothetical protein
MILAATEAARESMGVECDEDEEAIRAYALSKLGRETSLVVGAWEIGRALDLDAVLELARSG